MTQAVSPALETPLGKAVGPLAAGHGSDSGFRMISAGIDGLTARIEAIDLAQRSIDIQTYIFRADESGNLVVEALLRAAERGVRIRILVDDGETVAGDEKILALSGQPGFEVRIYNPLRYRGHNRFRRGVEFLFNKARVDYRMHNKLMVADNVVAIIGGRNIGNQYFQIDPASQFGDDDLVVTGPIVPRLSGVFDEFWNSPIAIPAQAVDQADTTPQALSEYKKQLAQYLQRLDAKRVAGAQSTPNSSNSPNSSNTPNTQNTSSHPFLDIGSGRVTWRWAPMKLVYDSPDKKDVAKGEVPGRLIYKAIADQANAVSSELIMVTPYFVPTQDEMAGIEHERERDARVRILTNSLETAPSLGAQSGYGHFRVKLLKAGVELHEVRALLGSARGSGQGRAISRHGNYGLHAKLYVFDRKISFVGSLNFDQRSNHLNTEIGLLVASPELSGEIAARFEALTQLDNSYAVTLGDDGKHLVWTTQENGTLVHRRKEPARNAWQRAEVRLLSLLPLDPEL